MIGDLRTAALVGPDGAIDWFCWPRFDSPSVFARLLDADKGGCWRLAPLDAGDGEMSYLPETALLVTEHQSAGGPLRVTDAMLAPASGAGSSIVRVVEAADDIELESVIDVRPDYARAAAAIAETEAGARFSGPGFDAELVIGGAEVVAVDSDGPMIRHRLRLGAGERASLVLACGQAATVDAVAALDDCARYWREWCRKCGYEGEFRDDVLRSAITLKLLTHEGTGAIVAAPTTSLPEEIGGVRNWDYRYSWLRDASLTVHALLATEQRDEAAPFMRWVCDRLGAVDDPEDLQIVYAVDGQGALTEVELEHLEGYKRSRPVRVGNAAHTQLQLDVYGEIVECLRICHDYELEIDDVWDDFRRLIDWVAENWRRADDGIWEVRSGRRHFVYSKVMAWVALDRGARLVETGRDGDGHRWRGEAEKVHADVLARGFSERLNSFTQSYDEEVLDASNLLIPLVGFLPRDDARVQGTIDAVLAHLTENGLVYRYRGADDGLPGGEGTFAVCTFWLASALAVCGRGAEARAVFEHMLGFRNRLGLYAEEIDAATGAQLGNFPQAFTHLGLIGAAIELARSGVAAAESTAAAP
ncbi:MAG: glycoside hydrolase family 15 protein [Gaiellaceae bacterium]